MKSDSSARSAKTAATREFGKQVKGWTVMRSRILIGSVCALALAATSAMAAREFNGSIWFPDTHPLTKAYLDWVKRLDAASKGELKAKIFTGTALLPPNAHLSGLKDGIAQVTYHAGIHDHCQGQRRRCWHSATPTRWPSFAVTDFGMTPDDGALQAARSCSPADMRRRPTI
jgi:hypothetical protein